MTWVFRGLLAAGVAMALLGGYLLCMSLDSPVFGRLAADGAFAEVLAVYYHVKSEIPVMVKQSWVLPEGAGQQVKEVEPVLAPTQKVSALELSVVVSTAEFVVHAPSRNLYLLFYNQPFGTAIGNKKFPLFEPGGTAFGPWPGGELRRVPGLLMRFPIARLNSAGYLQGLLDRLARIHKLGGRELNMLMRHEDVEADLAKELGFHLEKWVLVGWSFLPFAGTCFTIGFLLRRSRFEPLFAAYTETPNFWRFAFCRDDQEFIRQWWEAERRRRTDADEAERRNRRQARLAQESSRVQSIKGSTNGNGDGGQEKF